MGVGAYASRCSDWEEQEKFRGNIVHSSSGAGTVLFADHWGSEMQGEGQACQSLSYSYNYKCFEAFTTMSNFKKLQLHHIVTIDSQFGLHAGVTATTEESEVYLNGCTFYGDTLSPDGPDFLEIEKYGLILSTPQQTPKVHIERASHLPWFKPNSYPPNNMKFLAQNLIFQNWHGVTKNTQMQYAIHNNINGSDYGPMYRFRDTQFIDVNTEQSLRLQDPYDYWAVREECGNFGCTFPWNIFIQFVNSTTTGTQFTVAFPTAQGDTYYCVPDNPGLIPGLQRAGTSGVQVTDGNFYFVQGAELAQIVIESLDADKEDRMVSPLNITSQEDGGPLIVNVLNAFRDSREDGFYASQKRLQKFPGLIDTFYDYELVFTGTAPQKTKLRLDGDLSTQDTILTIDYTNAGNYWVLDKNNQRVQPNEVNPLSTDPTILEQYPITGSKCGENIWDPIHNKISVYIAQHCGELKLEPMDSVSGTFRLDIPIGDFFSQIGTTRFIDRLAASLAIHASTIKVVQVRSGSSIVHFQISSENDVNGNYVATNEEGITSSSNNDMAGLMERMQSLYEQGAYDLGAPILDMSLFTTAAPNQSTEETIGETVAVEVTQNVPWWAALLIVAISCFGCVCLCACACVTWQYCRLRKQKGRVAAIEKAQAAHKAGEPDIKIQEIDPSSPSKKQMHDVKSKLNILKGTKVAPEPVDFLAVTTDALKPDTA